LEPDQRLAAVLRDLREEAGLTQETLAARSGLTGGAYAQIELAHSNPAWATVRAIAAALDTSLVELARRVEAER